jgi:hypothetical protein
VSPEPTAGAAAEMVALVEAPADAEFPTDSTKILVGARP